MPAANVRIVSWPPQPPQADAVWEWWTARGDVKAFEPDPAEPTVNEESPEAVATAAGIGHEA